MGSSKKSYRLKLTDYERVLLNRKPNKESRYYITEEELRTIGGQDRLVRRGERIPPTAKIENESFTQGYKNSPRGVLTAWDENKQVMDIDAYCEYYGLPRADVSSYKLVSHTGVPFYNIVFKERFEGDDFDYIGAMERELEDVDRAKHKPKKRGKRKGVVKITDLHFGAYMEALSDTPKFSVKILISMLEKASNQINLLNYDIVHIHLLGDLIETFTGLNHKNVWKGIEYSMFGVKAVKLFTVTFKKHFLDRINNLGCIKIVAGNHDRVTSDRKEDVEGGAAELIAWGLESIGYDIEFSSHIIKHVVDDVCHILNHGHLDLTNKLTTQEMCWKYGEKGLFNYITEGHLHSRIQKLSASQVKKFKMITDDNADCRRQVCPSLFTGNTYSAQGGWSTKPGFLVVESNGAKGINVFDFSI
jgi:hypothetical protein